MPELPEVETIKRGVTPLVINKIIKQVIVRNSKLRWPVTRGLNAILSGQSFKKVSRRGKYLLFFGAKGTLLVHLGMSATLIMLSQAEPVGKHDHIDICFSDDACLRFNDPRRFGCVLWIKGDPLQHKLLCNLGPEPLSREFNDKYLLAKLQRRKAAIKLLLMDSKIVVGIGNIYASEVLFKANIHPAMSADKLTKQQCIVLVRAIKTILRAAIKSGGTSIKDYRQANGKPGYFQLKLYVYGRKNAACKVCNTILQEIKLGQRNTVFCPTCQQEMY